MNSMIILPGNYEEESTLDLSKNKTLVFNLSIACLVLFFVFGWLFMLLAFAISPVIPKSGGFVIPPSQSLPLVLVFLLVVSALFVFVLTVHELIHGLFFWLFTHTRPKYGFKWIYAYAAAPDWYIPRNQYVIIGLAPLVILTLVGLLLLRFLPTPGVFSVVFALTINAAGAVGDLFIVGLLLTKPANLLSRDSGTSMTFYRSK